MSQTVILAEDRQEALEAAANLGIPRQQYIYPSTPELLRGLQVRRVVYVSGWRFSRELTAETLQLLRSRLAESVVEIEQPNREEWMRYVEPAQVDTGRLGSMILSGQHTLTFAPQPSPFLDYDAQAPEPRREPWWRRLFSHP